MSKKADTNRLDQILVKAPEAARMLSISERLLWRQTKAGRIPFLRFGRSVRYPVSLLRKLIDEAALNAQEN